MDLEEDVGGGDGGSGGVSPGGGSIREFKKHKTEIKKLKKELVEIRHSEAPRGSGYEARMMDLNHDLKRKQREERRASLRSLTTDF